MKTCIICREEKSTSLFNEEHIIPAAIGGKFTIHNVCIACNSHLGKMIDNKLLRNTAILHYRNIFGLARQASGNIPNPFKGVHLDSEGNEHLVDYKEGVLKTQSLEQFELQNLPEDGGSIAKLTIPLEKIDQQDEIIKKYLKRHGAKNGEYTLLSAENNAPKSLVEVKATLDHNTFIFGCVKIAYEAINLLFPNCINDPEIDALRQFLKTVEITDSLKKVFNAGSELNTFYTNKLATIENLGINHHLILIEYLEGVGLVCVVKLFNLLYSTVLSKSYKPIDPGHEIVFYNDCLSNAHGTNINRNIINTLIQIDLNAVEQELEQQVRSSNGKIFKINGKTPVYNAEGQLLYEDVSDLGMAILSEPGTSYPWTAQNIKFEFNTGQYFLRATPMWLLPLLSVTMDIGVNLQKITNYKSYK